MRAYAALGALVVTMACNGGNSTSTQDAAPTADFVQYATVPTMAPAFVAVADFDEDGFPDLFEHGATGLSTNGYASWYAVLRNDGHGNLQSSDNTSTYGGCDGGPAIGDATGDGHLDVACAGFPQLMFARGTGAGGLGGPIYDNTQAKAAVAYWPVMGVDTLVVEDGSGLIAETVTSTDLQLGARISTTIHDRLAVGDLDGDGKPELLASDGPGGANGTLTVYSGSDMSAHDYPMRAGELLLADLDHDGHPDLIANGDPIAISLVVAGVPTTPRLITRPAGTMLIGDLDGDQIPDLLFVTDGPQLTTMRGTGTGSFDAPHSLTIQSAPLPVAAPAALADFDGDGRLDLVIGGGQSQMLTLYRGQGG